MRRQRVRGRRKNAPVPVPVAGIGGGGFENMICGVVFVGRKDAFGAEVEIGAGGTFVADAD